MSYIKADHVSGCSPSDMIIKLKTHCKKGPSTAEAFSRFLPFCLELDLVSGHDIGVDLIRIGLAAHRDAGGQFLVRRYGIA